MLLYGASSSACPRPLVSSWLLLLLPVLPCADIRRSKRLRKVGILACTGVFILCLGMVAGFFISKYVGTEILSRNGRDCYGVLDDGGQPSTTASGVSGLPQQFQRGMPLNVSGMRQLPQPGTQAALDMQNSPDAPCRFRRQRRACTPARLCATVTSSPKGNNTLHSFQL